VRRFPHSGRLPTRRPAAVAAAAAAASDHHSTAGSGVASRELKAAATQSLDSIRAREREEKRDSDASQLIAVERNTPAAAEKLVRPNRVSAADRSHGSRRPVNLRARSRRH